MDQKKICIIFLIFLIIFLLKKINVKERFDLDELKKTLETEYLPELEKKRFQKEYTGDLSFEEFKAHNLRKIFLQKIFPIVVI